MIRGRICAGVLASLAISLLLLAQSCARISRPAATTQPSTRPALALAHGPYLQAPSETGMTIMWATNRPCVSHVEYGIAPGELRTTAYRSRDGLIDANTTLHRVTLSGLKAGTTYYYRVVSREILQFKPYNVTYGETIASDVGRFTTLDLQREKFSFIVLNDRHEKVPQLQQALGSVNWDGVNLVFFNGDMLGHVEDEAQIYRNLIDPSTRFFAGSIPFIFVRGNHETRGIFARNLGGYVASPLGRYYWSFGHGGVRFLVLDSGEDKIDSCEEYSGLVDFDRYMEAQTRWLSRELKTDAFARAGFRVVFIHMPPWNKVDPKFIRQRWLLDTWGPLLRDARVDLLLCGHTHHYAEHFPTAPGLSCPMIVGGINTVIRGDVTADGVTLTTTLDDGTVLSAGRRVDRSTRMSGRARTDSTRSRGWLYTGLLEFRSVPR